MSNDSTLTPILFVDDEENILSALKRLLREEPYEISTANSAAAGIDILKRRPDIGVIVTDQRMPGMSGVEFLEKARELVPDATRIVLTGYADITAAVDAINKGGAYRYIGKPWNDEDILVIVREAASRHALVRENKRLTDIVHRQNLELQRRNALLEELYQRKYKQYGKRE
jgi:DNA-binding NtrC family response regulator